MVLDPKANLADMRNPTPELVNEVKGAIAKKVANNTPYGKDNFSFYPFSESQVIKGIEDGKAHFAEPRRNLQTLVSIKK